MRTNVADDRTLGLNDKTETLDETGKEHELYKHKKGAHGKCGAAGYWSTE